MRRDVTALHEAISTGDIAVPEALPALPVALLGLLARRPGVVDWLSFRARTVTAFVAQLAREVKGRSKKLGGYLFAPALAPLVGQDYRALAAHLDLLCPMLYRNCRERGAIAPVNTEIHAISTWFGERGDEAAGWATGFFGHPGERPTAAERLLEVGLSPEAMGAETARARAMIGGRALVPIIWWDDALLDRTARAVEASGADGVSFFLFNEHLRAALEGQ